MLSGAEPVQGLLQHAHCQGDVNCLHRQSAMIRMNVIPQRIAPLLLVLGVSPFGFVRGNEALAHLLGGHDFGGLDRGRGFQLATAFAQIDPYGDQAAVLGMQIAGELERNILDRAYADPDLLAVDVIAAGPRLRGRLSHLHVEPVTIVVLPGAERLWLAGAGPLYLNAVSAIPYPPSLKPSAATHGVSYVLPTVRKHRLARW
jgi:hypothetical protein